MLPWPIVLASFFAFVFVGQRIVRTQIRTGRIAVRDAGIILAAMWALFPFLGLLVGAPWSAPVILVAATIIFAGGIVGTLVVTRGRDTSR
jgi:hypothetical protein